jgi:GH25 family lysozyme M1 (1,4-beta-N-acetylmuramidase)
MWLALLATGCGRFDLDELNQASTQQCPSATVEGVDVYQGDSPIVWSTVQASGRVFAFSKASQGNYNTQSNFATNWATLKSLGMIRGAYHYFDATIDGTLQAQWYLMQVNQAGGFAPGDLPPVLDLECPVSTVQNSPGNMCLGNGSSGWEATATVIQRTWDWLHAVEAATGVKPIIYSYPTWFATFGFTDPTLTEYPLWIADPNSPTCASVPAPWTAAVFWQYSSSKPVPGIGGTNTPADRDRFMGTLAQLQGFVAPLSGSDGGGDLAGAHEDAGPPDLSSGGDAGGTPKGHSGCGCELGARARADGGAIALAALAVAAVIARRRRVRGFWRGLR